LLVLWAGNLVGKVLPFSIDTWVQSFASNPWPFAVGGAVLVALAWTGKRLEAGITDEMLEIWTEPPASGSVPDDWVYRLRNHPRYRALVHAIKHTVLPNVLGVILLVLVVFGVFAALSRVLFHGGSTLGLVCAAHAAPTPVTAPVAVDAYQTRARCWGSGWTLRAGEPYTIRVELPGTWQDGDIAVDGPAGFGTEGMTWPMYAGLPLRRSLAEPWFALTARIGSMGADEYALAWARAPDGTPRHFVARLVPRKDGELFLFVNDAVVGLPFLTDVFYRNNDGTARVTVSPARPGA
jgi:hypothetical protein